MRSRRSALTAVITLLTLVCVPVLPAHAYPRLGDMPWSVLLCKFSDLPDTTRYPEYFAELFTDAGKGVGGFADFLADQSRGRAGVAGSTVKGWYTMPVTYEEAKTKSRWQRSEDCVQTAASAGYTVPSGHRIAVMINGAMDSGSVNGRVVLDPYAWDLGFTTHEVLHGYGMDHSFSDDPTYRNVEWSQIGEYDDEWDVMSARHIHTYWTEWFGASAVGLNGPMRDEAGWLERSRVVTLGSDGVASRTVRLAPLERPDLPGSLMVRIPFDPDDLFHYYTVEFRKKTGQSAGIPGDVVLLHEVKGGTTYLLRSRSDREPVNSLNANGVSVSVDSVTQDEAVVTVSTDITQKCTAGHVFRLAVPQDRVCVTPTIQERTRYENENAELEVGEDGECRVRRTHRLAVPGDNVCVNAASRRQVIADNAAAASRVNPARLVLGPNACKPGYVWREADGIDQVCVTPEIRNQVFADNAAAAGRWTSGPYGQHTCVPGYVWREAFTGDDVCVTGDRRERARQDTRTASERVLRPWG